jgi:hypothetical protein
VSLELLAVVNLGWLGKVLNVVLVEDLNERRPRDV